MEISSDAEGELPPTHRARPKGIESSIIRRRQTSGPVGGAAPSSPLSPDTPAPTDSARIIKSEQTGADRDEIELPDELNWEKSAPSAPTTPAPSTSQSAPQAALPTSYTVPPSSSAEAIRPPSSQAYPAGNVSPEEEPVAVVVDTPDLDDDELGYSSTRPTRPSVGTKHDASGTPRLMGQDAVPEENLGVDIPEPSAVLRQSQRPTTGAYSISAAKVSEDQVSVPSRVDAAAPADGAQRGFVDPSLDLLKALSANDFQRAAGIYRTLLPTGTVPRMRPQDEFLIAEALEQLGHPKVAVKAYHRAANTNPEGRYAARSLFKAGVILAEKLGRRAQAAALLRHVVENYSSDPLSIRARQALQKLE